MVDCLSLEKVMKKNEKLFALKQLFWFFKNWVVLMVLTANHINHDMVVLDHLSLPIPTINQLGCTAQLGHLKLAGTPCINFSLLKSWQKY